MSQYRSAEQALLSYLPANLEWRLYQVKIPREFWKDVSGSPLNAAASAAAAKVCRPGAAAAGRWRATPVLPEYYEINTLSVTGKKGQPSVNEKPHLVLVHGWGGALGMWLRNLEELSEHYTVHAIDLLGWGGSSRPPFSSIYPSTSSSTAHATALAAQAYFVDSLESWRAAQNISTFHLVGHSMGGFISASYYLRFPHRLSNLTLLSPIGLQGFQAPPTATLRTKLQAALVHQAWQFTPQRILVHVLGKDKAREMVMRARTRIARMFGRGGGAGQGHRDIPPAVIVDYLLAGIHRAPGVAGEAAFAKLGSPAKGWVVPLDAQLKKALVSSPDGRLADAEGSLAIAYGVGDWIDPRYALWDLQPSVLKENAAAKLEVYLVEGAGHHAYVENVRVMNDIVLRKRECVREARDEPGLVAEMVQARSRGGGGGFMSIA
ncbi:Alpha/Beta hydrolase protein [Catenaria anguillulae PL171]|uniref:Alpha/Beta hydrolase protein n=1 Tax=Catenaria anguillulae PL171 TaxID=765915 RepID=A0A1Y2HL01_9FUNG|nr:Alpha/Beta hydrolase protein [Catenaria anguillulae PL171]